jgi:hypothetical protein
MYHNEDLGRAYFHRKPRRPFAAQQHTQTWPQPETEPGIFEDDAGHALIGFDLKPHLEWSKAEAIRRKQGHMVCSSHSVGLFGYRSCYYQRYVWPKRLFNFMKWYLNQKRGALNLRQRRAINQRLKQLARKKTDSHWLE